jgi:hypothetical protein
MRNRRGNPLVLVPSQVEHRANHGKIDLTNRQIAHLQRNGLLAGAQNWYYSPDGAFALAPIHPDARSPQRRKRVYLAPVTSLKAA